MNTLKKNQIIITALAIMIVVAGYLNFTDKANVDEKKHVFNNSAINNELLGQTGEIVPNEDNVTLGEVLQNEENIALGEVLQKENSEDAIIDNVTEDASETTPEATPEAEETVAQNNESTVGEAVLVNSNAVGKEYFINAKIDREQTRAQSVEILLEVINNDNLGEEQKVKAAAEMMELQERVEKEAAAESLLEAKGFSEVFVRMDENSADVVVNNSNLTEADLAQISDVVSRKTGIDPANIVITPLQTNK